MGRLTVQVTGGVKPYTYTWYIKTYNINTYTYEWEAFATGSSYEAMVHNTAYEIKLEVKDSQGNTATTTVWINPTNTVN